MSAIDRLVNNRKTSSVAMVQGSAIEPPQPSSDQEMTGRVLRLKKPIGDQIDQHCDRIKATRDTWVEAVWLVLSQNPELAEQVNAIAKQRRDDRQKEGKRKRLQTMQRNLI